MVRYSTFPFFNELEILELRLREHWKYIDKFVIVESTHTQQGGKKPLYLADNWNRFAEFREKIIHVVYHPTAYDFEQLQRNAGWLEERQRCATIEGLVHASDGDIVMMSDADEVPDLREIDFDSIQVPSHFAQIFSGFFVNFRAPNALLGGTNICRKRDYTYESIPHLRAMHTNCPKIGNEWHFSWLVGEDGGVKRIVEKCHSIWEGIQAPFLDTDKFEAHVLRAMNDGTYNLFGRGGAEYSLQLVDWDAGFPENMPLIVEKYPYLWKSV